MCTIIRYVLRVLCVLYVLYVLCVLYVLYVLYVFIVDTTCNICTYKTLYAVCPLHVDDSMHGQLSSGLSGPSRLHALNESRIHSLKWMAYKVDTWATMCSGALEEL